jgi:hypothetical protein
LLKLFTKNVLHRPSCAACAGGVQAAGHKRCAVMVSSGGRTGPSRCHSPVSGYALVRYPAGQDMWCVFLCASHRAAVLLAGPLDRVAVAELHDRDEQHRLALAGQSFRRPLPLQSARG